MHRIFVAADDAVEIVFFVCMFCTCWKIAVTNFIDRAKSSRDLTFLFSITTKRLVPVKFKTKR
jgi:hypothetical protein